jgi:hypothetical protein
VETLEAGGGEDKKGMDSFGENCLGQGSFGGYGCRPMSPWGLKVKKRGLPWTGQLGGIWLQTYVSLGLKREEERTDRAAWRDVVADRCKDCLNIPKTPEGKGKQGRPRTAWRFETELHESFTQETGLIIGLVILGLIYLRVGLILPTP